MATTRDLIVKILGDTSSLKSSLASGEQSLNSFQSGVSSKFKNFDPLADMGRSVGTTIAGYAAVGVAASAAFSFIKSSVQASMEDEREQRILAQTLRDTVGATNEVIASNESWITSTQNATGVMDSQIRDALVPLVASTHDVASAHSLLQTAMDISTARGLDLTAVSVALAKAHDGNLGALGRLGIQYKDTEGNVLSFDQVVRNANRTFGGATAEAADTASGKLAIMSAKVQDLKEQIGAELTPAISGWADVMSNTTIPAISALMGWMDSLYQKAAQGYSVFTNLGNIIGNFLHLGGGGGGPSTSGFSGGGGGGAGSPTGKTGLGTASIPGPGPLPGLNPSDISGLVGVTQAMAQQKYKQDALAAWVAGLPSAGGGGGGGGKSQAQKDAEKAAEDAKRKQEEQFKAYLDLLVNARDEQRKIEDEMYDDQKISLDQYLAILEKRLAGEQENSDAWIAIKDQERQVLRQHAKDEVADAKKAADDLKKIQDQRLKDMQDALTKTMEIQDNEYREGAISADEYLGILRGRLAGVEQFTNEWTSIFEEIKSVSANAGYAMPSLGSVGATVGGVGDSIVGGSGMSVSIANATFTATTNSELYNQLVTLGRTNGGIAIPGGVRTVS